MAIIIGHVIIHMKPNMAITIGHVIIYTKPTMATIVDCVIIHTDTKHTNFIPDHTIIHKKPDQIVHLHTNMAIIMGHAIIHMKPNQRVNLL